MNPSMAYTILENNMFRKFNFPNQPKMLVNFVITYNCNSRCKICNIWKKKKQEKEFTLDEFEKFIDANKIWWIAYTGGEPFLRSDILDIWKIADMDFSITSNGILTERIVNNVKEYLSSSARRIGINISIEGDEKTHNFVRGLDCFKRTMKTYEELKRLKEKHDNLFVGLVTTISRFNQDSVVDFIRNNSDKDFMVRPATYSDYYNTDESPVLDNNKMTKILESLERLDNVTNSRTLIDVWKKYFAKPRQLLPCYSGWSSVWVAPNWDIFPCISRENFKIGNLKEVDFKIKELWNNDKIKEHRKYAKNCYCPSDCEVINSMRYDWKCLLSQMRERQSKHSVK